MQKIFKHDWLITLFCLLISLFGLIVLYSTTYRVETSSDTSQLFAKQILFLILGFIGYFGISLINFSWFENKGVIRLIYLIILGLLLFVKFFGTSIVGTNRWISIGFFNLQPSEFAKVAIIFITIAAFTKNNKEHPLFEKTEKKPISSISLKNTIASIFTNPIISNILFSMLLIFLIFIQPSLGNAIITFIIWILVFILTFPKPKNIILGILISLLVIVVLNIVFEINSQENLLLNLRENMNYFFLILPFIILAGIIFLFKLKPLFYVPIIFLTIFIPAAFIFSWNNVLTNYQKNRVEIFMQGPESDPTGSGYQIIQSKVAIGSGMLIGRGFLEGSQSNLHVLTQAYTDFAFAALCEQFGFIGALIVLLIYALLIYRVISIATKTKNNFAKLLCISTGLLLCVQIFINIGMNTGNLPVTGIPLPLFSYGGSSIMMNMLLLGVIQSININLRSIDIADNLMLTSRSLVFK